MRGFPPNFFRTIALLALCCTASAQQRVPWTTSRIQGTPEPPPPYVVERLYPGLTFKKPLDVTPLPGSDRLVVLEETGKMYSFVPGASVEKADLFGELSAYDPETSRSYALTFHPRFAENRFVFTWVVQDLQGA